jgi:hypothetical protein
VYRPPRPAAIRIASRPTVAAALNSPRAVEGSCIAEFAQGKVRTLGGVGLRGAEGRLGWLSQRRGALAAELVLRRISRPAGPSDRGEGCHTGHRTSCPRGFRLGTGDIACEDSQRAGCGHYSGAKVACGLTMVNKLGRSYGGSGELSSQVPRVADYVAWVSWLTGKRRSPRLTGVQDGRELALEAAPVATLTPYWSPRHARHCGYPFPSR